MDGQCQHLPPRTTRVQGRWTYSRSGELSLGCDSLLVKLSTEQTALLVLKEFTTIYKIPVP